MQSDKISLIIHLRDLKNKQEILFDHFLAILHENAVTLHQARRFLVHANIKRETDWRIKSNEEILNILDQSYNYIVRNRSYWSQQRRLYQGNLLKFHQLYEKVAVNQQNANHKSKVQIMAEMQDETSKRMMIMQKRWLSQQEYDQLLLNLSAIIRFQQLSSQIIFSNDYQSNQLINLALEQINAKICNQNIIKSHLRKNTQAVLIKKLKTSPGNLKKSKSIGQIKGKQITQQRLIRNNSQRLSLGYKHKRNFIQEVREQIKKQELKSAKSKTLSDNESTLVGSNRLVSVHLPKILKISDEQLSTQGIYKSLKKFANFDYVAQQKKIRDIIGISLGEDEQYMSAYFSKERSVKQQKIVEQHINRQERRKKILEGLAKKQHHHCKRYNPQEVQPYMRF